MATRRVTITNTDGSVAVDKSYTIADELVPHYIEAYGSVYTPPAKEDGTPGDPYTQMQICEKAEDGIVEGQKVFVQGYLREKAEKKARAELPDITIK
jgi:hypothetical protein